jgi:hypothetical protein
LLKRGEAQAVATMAAMTRSDEATNTRERPRHVEEGHMCPACIESTVAMVAGAASTGGVLAVCISKLRRVLRVSSLGLFQKRKEK